MPLWNIYHPSTTFTTPPEKDLFVADILAYYHSQGTLPAFYVVVNFHPMPAGTMYRGSTPVSEQETPFIRITISHLAASRRDFPEGVGAARMRRGVDEACRRSIVEKGWGWEYHVMEDERDLWKIDGVIPPPFRGEVERKWREEDKVSEWEGGREAA
ncbi:putative oxalocrotonate tautomerase [Teratosphaeria destructans]|uniref:Oxalocrotonate tautomerase n=1 Tax=Teratosphaeria destructans TaxID=418781 RepID=A0A9W7W334_9PEZI|nr:putative oxalocrotonate tautomerase [Teratosphaeria destructans]